MRKRIRPTMIINKAITIAETHQIRLGLIGRSSRTCCEIKIDK